MIFIASATMGLESVVKEECLALGFKNIKEDVTVNGHFYKKVYYKKVKKFIEKYKKFKGNFPKSEEIKKVDGQENVKSFDEINEMLELDNGKVLNLEKED